MKITYFDSLPSTSTYIRENIDKVLENEYIVAINQTNGRGRCGNIWFSQKGNLMFSFSINTKKYNSNIINIITLIVGLSLFEAIKEYCKIDKGLEIKWPNDLMLNSKKLSGILCENVSGKDKVVVGIGVNTNQKLLDESIKSKAISLCSVTEYEIDNEQLLITFDKHLNLMLNELKNEYNNSLKKIVDKLNKYNFLINKKFTINDDSQEYIGKCITQEGLLSCVDLDNNKAAAKWCKVIEKG